MPLPVQMPLVQLLCLLLLFLLLLLQHLMLLLLLLLSAWTLLPARKACRMNCAQVCMCTCVQVRMQACAPALTSPLVLRGVCDVPAPRNAQEIKCICRPWLPKPTSSQMGWRSPEG